MRKYAVGAALVALVFSAGLFSGHFRAFGQAAESADPIFGTWKMDLARSVRNRDGKSTPFTEQATRVLTPEGDGLSMSVTNGPNGKPSAYSGKFDGKDYPDPRAPGQDRTLAHWRVTPNMIVRLQKTKGVPSEWVVYTVSPDGNMLTANSWIPDKPQFVETQVYTRAK
jgi:hypothetical protein